LPAGQQQVLDRIETDLEGCEPRLRSMFAIFTRLTRDEGAPRTESLSPRSQGRLAGHRRAVVAVPVILGLVALFVFMAISTGPAAHWCRPGAVRTASCQVLPHRP
jgi:hypothetical protein